MMSPCPHLGSAPPPGFGHPPPHLGSDPPPPPQVLDIPSTSGVRPPHQDVVPAQDEESLSSDIPSPVHSPLAMDSTSPLHSPSSPHLPYVHELETTLMGLQAKIKEQSSRANQINVFRGEELDCALRAFARSTFDPEARIDVVFIDIEGVGEGAVDEGGPTREFCTLLMRQIQAYLIFEGPEERRTLALDSVALQKGHYKIIGQMIVVCLLQGLVSPHFLSDRLFQQVRGLPPTPASLYLVYDMGLRAKFQKIAEATTVEAAKEAVEEASEELSLMGGMRFISNLSQRDELLAAVLHHYCDGRLLEALQQ
ncbi:uncharacterized protein [Notothenia coriiceps]|uniref:HECT domain-containing protein n=1 Tax=Notothenia coriiceps TaxID=8208 RepID=A0A6I9PGP1_9TELE|nr:PREDICTED: uncharacterized protein LOC104959927 [Notothenia coriiceps]